MKSVARGYLWWPGMDKKIENVAKSCQSCQEVKGTPPAAPLHPWVWPSKPWQRVHLDFAGPFRGVMFLVGMDAHSKWPEVQIMSSTTASKTVDVLREWFARHGLPEQLVTDNGSQFIAEEFEVFTKQNRIKHVRSAPYHPASNGLVERFVQSLKQSLKASEGDGRSLYHRLSTFLLSYRTTPQATTGVPPCQLLMQRDLRTRLSLLQPDRDSTVLSRQSAQKSIHDRHSKSRLWIAGDRVMIRNHRPGPDWIPGTVVEVLGPVTYIVDTDEGQRWKRHADQLKNWITPTPRIQAESSHSRDKEESPFPESPQSERDPVTSPEQETDRAPISCTESSETGPSSSHTETHERRYPERVHRPPDRYT